MNYAALLALLVLLAFLEPFVVGFAENIGLSRGYSIATTLAGAVFTLAWLLIRQRIHKRRNIESRIKEIEARCQHTPTDPEMYCLEDDHLGDLYLTLGQEEQALAAFKAYAHALGLHNTQDIRVQRVISRLETRLMTHKTTS